MPVGIDTQYHWGYQVRKLNCIFATYSKRRVGIFLIYLWRSAGDSGPYQATKSVYI